MLDFRTSGTERDSFYSLSGLDPLDTQMSNAVVSTLFRGFVFHAPALRPGTALLPLEGSTL